MFSGKVTDCLINQLLPPSLLIMFDIVFQLRFVGGAVIRAIECTILI